ncbi:hypothetical protein EFK50_10150 [Nocardioides marmoriginsengisoli]|uniref:DUF1906 domain-containing protein n=1 Tax=Nocardioides marmoriginsengisoli TaxID=661483 RepID=A0A3N0CFB9_9ACTN|nr:hypothetical protein [Nocardioides marmoriginsengisoli]RNL62154.1 hypothetical protein EFK50_10150 [Nocardioides marmoriginsengisoli]
MTRASGATGKHRWALAVLLVGVLAGCGSQVRPTSTPTPTPTATPDGDGSLVPDNLPDLTSIPKPTGTPSVAVTPRTERIFGADVSWPQCPKGMGIPQKRSHGAPMPTAAAEFVIIGLTNGPSFFPNPCLADQVRWVADRGLLGAAYAVVSYPDDATLRRYGGTGPYDGSTELGALRNVGYQAALFNVAGMKAAGLRSPIVWIDVEPVPTFVWSEDVVANAAVVQGTARGYTDAGFAIGFYSTPVLWKRVVGDLRFGAPEWRAAGQTSQQEALSRCGDDWSFAGGRGIFGQWVEAGRDRNVSCPGAVTDLRTWFHQY